MYNDDWRPSHEAKLNNNTFITAYLLIFHKISSNFSLHLAKFALVVPWENVIIVLIFVIGHESIWPTMHYALLPLSEQPFLVNLQLLQKSTGDIR